jgi:hypothetical protein
MAVAQAKFEIGPSSLPRNGSSQQRLISSIRCTKDTHLRMLYASTMSAAFPDDIFSQQVTRTTSTKLGICCRAAHVSSTPHPAESVTTHRPRTEHKDAPGLSTKTGNTRVCSLPLGSVQKHNVHQPMCIQSMPSCLLPFHDGPNPDPPLGSSWLHSGQPWTRLGEGGEGAYT